MNTSPPLDEDVPQGDPEAVFCRWHHTGRVRGPGGSGLICLECDTNPNARVPS